MFRILEYYYSSSGEMYGSIAGLENFGMHIMSVNLTM
jgi:hypothetical protein